MRAAPTHAAGRDPDPADVGQAPHHTGASPGLTSALTTVAVLVALAATAGTTLYLTGAVGTPEPQPRMAGSATAVASAEASAEAGAGAGAGASEDRAAEPTPEPMTGPSTQPGSGSRRQWARLVLASWDVDRARAWRRADPAALRDLYLPGSRAAQRDVDLLERWSRAGWRVRELRTEVQRLQVVGLEQRQVVLRVRDRVAEVVAENQRTGRVRRWPEQEWSTRTLRLRRADERWKVVSVT